MTDYGQGLHELNMICSNYHRIFPSAGTYFVFALFVCWLVGFFYFFSFVEDVSNHAMLHSYGDEIYIEDNGGDFNLLLWNRNRKWKR